MFNVGNEIRKYLQTRKAYLLICFDNKKVKGGTKTSKTHFISSNLKKISSKYEIDLEKLNLNTYITKKRYAISKLIKFIAEVEENIGGGHYFFVRSLTIKSLRSLKIDEASYETLKEFLRKGDLSQEVKKTLRKILQKYEKRKKVSRTLKLSEELNIVQKPRFRLILIFPRKNMEVKKRYSLLKNLKKQGFEMERIIYNVYVSKTRHSLIKLLEALNLVKKTQSDLILFAGIRLSKKVIEFFRALLLSQGTTTGVESKNVQLVETARKLIEILEKDKTIKKAISYSSKLKEYGIEGSLRTILLQILRKFIETYKE